VIALLVILSIPFSPEKRPSHIAVAQWLLWIGAYVSFLAAFWLAARFATPARWLLMVWQTLSVLTIVSTRPALGLEGALMVLVAFQLGAVDRPRAGIGWITLQSLGLLAILEWRFGLEHALSVFAAYYPFQLLAFYTSRVLARESSAREALAAVNAELFATRELLAAHSRAGERLRISRELHDVFGHRLAALSVNLEAATRVRDEERLRFIERGHESAKALLRDVREVVANLRRETPVDLRDLMESVVAGIPRPAIHLDCDAGIAAVEPETAQLLVRCAQEVVTNSIKHASSENLWLQLHRAGNGLQMIARDDGRGAWEWSEGNGLRGIRERLEIAGGSIHIESKHGSGFRVQLYVPGAPS
jgi:signal transduction histidine kinase